MINKALVFAKEAHKGQLRRVNNEPYDLHPIGVAKLLKDYGYNDKLIIAGLLHDTLEDTNVTEDEIRNTFGEEVLSLVKEATEPDRTLSWGERKKHTVKYVFSEASENALPLICADKLNNLQSLVKSYNEMGDKLWNYFNAPKEKQEWYYTSLAKAFVSVSTNKLYNDFYDEVYNFFKKKN